MRELRPKPAQRVRVQPWEIKYLFPLPGLKISKSQKSVPRMATNVFFKILSCLTAWPPAAKNAIGSTNNFLLLNFNKSSFCYDTNMELFSLYYCSQLPLFLLSWPHICALCKCPFYVCPLMPTHVCESTSDSPCLLYCEDLQQSIKEIRIFTKETTSVLAKIPVLKSLTSWLRH